MPTGNYVSEKEKERILDLRAQDLSYKVIAIRLGLHWKTIYDIVKEEEKKNSLNVHSSLLGNKERK